MTISYKLLAKGKKNLGSAGGHLDRMMKALAEAKKNELTLDELVQVVKRHSDGEPRSIASWYLSRASDMSWVSRQTTKEDK